LPASSPGRPGRIVSGLRLITHFRQALMQPLPDFVGRVRLPAALVARDEYSPSGDPDDPGQPEQLPNGAHAQRLCA